VIHSGPEVLFKTCVAMKFVDDDDLLTYFGVYIFFGHFVAVFVI